MNKRLIYDVAQCAAVLSIFLGVWSQFGWPFALIALGLMVLLLGFVDIIIFRAR